MHEDKGKYILFIDSKSLSFFDGKIVTKEDLDPKVIKDFDVLDRSAFDGFVDIFIKKNGRTAGSVSVVLANDVCISNDLSETDPNIMNEKMEQFIDAVPYGQVLAKNYRTKDGIRTVATNKETVELIAEVLGKEGFVVETVTPAMMFPGYVPGRVLDEVFATTILENYSSNLSGSMINKIAVQQSETPKQVEVKQKSKALPYMLLVFGILLVVLVALLILRR